MNNIYQEKILDHSQNPRHYGSLSKPTKVVTYTNESCGDEVKIELQIEKDIIKDIAFQNKGCVLSTASTSILTDYLVGKSLAEVKKIKAQKLFEIVGITPSTARMKCVLLPLEAVQKVTTYSGVKTK